jgi:hypothetical protein
VIGRCLRCGAVGPVELDHPTGRVEGRPVHPELVAPLCKPCHKAKGRRDRAAGVEGGPPTLFRVLVRLAVWFGWLAEAGCEVVLEPGLLRALAAVLEALARGLGPE